MRLNYDANRALTEINTQVNSVRNQLPPEAQQPVLNVQVGQQIDAMYMGFYSECCRPTTSPTTWSASSSRSCDRSRACRPPRCSARASSRCAPGSIRRKLAAYGVTATDVRTALGNNNYLSALGTTKGQMVSVDLTAATEPALGR